MHIERVHRFQTASTYKFQRFPVNLGCRLGINLDNVAREESPCFKSTFKLNESLMVEWALSLVISSVFVAETSTWNAFCAAIFGVRYEGFLEHDKLFRLELLFTWLCFDWFSSKILQSINRNRFSSREKFYSQKKNKNIPGSSWNSAIQAYLNWKTSN